MAHITHISALDCKHYKTYNKLFSDMLNKYILICSELLFTYFYGDEVCNYYNIKNKYLDNIFKIKRQNSKGNPSYNYQYIIVKNNIKNSKSLVISSISSIIYQINLDIGINFDVFLLYNYYENIKNKLDKINIYLKAGNINNIFSSHIKKQYIESLQKLKDNSLSISKYSLITCHYEYIKGLSLNASYQFLLKLPDVIASLGVAFKTLESGGKLLLFWTIINIHVPSVRKILILLAHAFNSVRVVSDDINQNFFQGVTEYYIECSGYRANLSIELINQLLEISINTVEYTYDICDILDYYEFYSRMHPNQSLFYKYSPEDNKLISSISRNSSTSKISKTSKTTKKTTKRSLRISQFLASRKSSRKHTKTSSPTKAIYNQKNYAQGEIQILRNQIH